MINYKDLLKKHPELLNYAKFIEKEGKVHWKPLDFKNLRIPFVDYFFKKNNPEDKYADFVDKFYEDLYKLAMVWGKENGYTIYDKGDFYLMEKIPEPTMEEKSAKKRDERNYLLETVIDPVVTNPLRWEELSKEEQNKYKEYRFYLLNIPQQEEFPDIEIKSFEEFLQ